MSLARSPLRRSVLVPRCAAAPRTAESGRPRALKRAALRGRIARTMAPELVARPGPARHARARWSAGTRARGRRCGPWLGSARSRSAPRCWWRSGSSPTSSTPGPQRDRCCRASTSRQTLDGVGHILFRNSLVLALHAMACVAGFIAGSSLPLRGRALLAAVWRCGPRQGRPARDRLRDRRDALLARAPRPTSLGSAARDAVAQLAIMPSALLLLGLLPHALPELVGALPAARRVDRSPAAAARWDELLAATFVTVAIAIPMRRRRRLHRGLRLAAPHPRAARLAAG